MNRYIITDNNKKLKINTLTSFKDRIKGYRFYLYPIKEGLCYPKKKMINTYFVCQKLDIVVTDKENNILAIYPSIKTEKFIRPRLKAYYIYLLPEGSSKGLENYEKLRILTKGNE